MQEILDVSRLRWRTPTSRVTAIEFIRPGDRAWVELLNQALCYDFYHLPAYHEMAEARGEGEANLCAYRDGDCTIAIPLLLRRIREAPGLEGSLALDATSVYGYPGPIVAGAPSAEVVQRFQARLKHALEQRDVVSVFSRLHPLLLHADCLQGLGELDPVGPTIAIDLRLAQEEQWARYRRNHKHGINKLRRIGVVCLDDRNFDHIHEFIRIYQESMRRVDAKSYYFFDRSYFQQLRMALGDRLHLYLCWHSDEVICGGLFVHTGDIVQYHLGGTDSRYLKWAPMKLLFDTVRRDFGAGRAAWFHLGGGLGGQQDSLYHFKSGFGGAQHTFFLWKWVVQEGAYEALCRQRPGVPHHPTGGFFPRYRM